MVGCGWLGHRVSCQHEVARVPLIVWQIDVDPSDVVNALNYDELVVYTASAIVPVAMIVCI